MNIGGLHVTDAGTGRPLVLLHAFPVSGQMYAAQLADPPCRLIVPDLPGFGSSPPRAIETLDDMARAVLDVLDALDIERATIGGTSMGGYVTFALYRLATERFDGMILADTKMTSDPPAAQEQREINAQRALAEGVLPVLDSMLVKLIWRREVEPQVREMAADARPESVASALRAMAIRPDSTETLRGVSVPAHIICGEHDALSSIAEHEAMRDTIADARLSVIEGAGHLAALEAPEAFLQRLSDTG